MSGTSRAIGAGARCGRGGIASAALLAVAAGAFLAGSAGVATAESLRQALESTYVTNQELEAQRASTRATDENVPQALSTGRPRLSGSGDVGYQRQETILNPPLVGSAGRVSPYGFSITATQPVFRGFRTLNSVKQADSIVRAAREALLNTEQNVLFSAAETYVNVVRDGSIVSLRANNVNVLTEQLRATRDRFTVGEVTRTDVAQAEARLSLAISTLNLARANLNSSRAVYDQVIGHPANGPVQPPSIELKLPRSLDEALLSADSEHPAIRTAIYSAEAADFGVDVTTGELLPTVSLDASFTKRWDPTVATKRTETAAITGRVTVPFYQGGEVSSRVRQAKEVRAQRRLELELVRRQVRAAVISAWGQLDATKAQIRSGQAQVRASEVALAGVREEAKVGQRTTLDVLDAEQELLDARVSLVSTRRDYVVASYALLSAVGRLSASKLGLNVAIYDPMVNYNKVRNKWFGLGPSDQN
ncbi:MAG: TolC family outer membrane protein [Rhodobiaceae bacterium]|nr:TolC family outer membrane protein [Rhodobiaceae bacterium]